MNATWLSGPHNHHTRTNCNFIALRSTSIRIEKQQKPSKKQTNIQCELRITAKMVKQKYAAFELGNDIVAVAESISTQQTMITVIIIMFLWPHQAHTHTHTEICGVDKRVIPPSIFNASHQLRARGKFDLLTGIYFHPFKLHTIIMWCFSRAGGSRKQFFGGIVCCVREYNYCTPKTEFLLLVFILLLLLFVNLHLIAFPHKFWFVDFSRAWTQNHAYNKHIVRVQCTKIWSIIDDDLLNHTNSVALAFDKSSNHIFCNDFPRLNPI